MSANILQIVSVIAFVLGGIFSVLSVVLFFRLNIRAVINDLNGKTAEKQIKEFREKSYKSETNKSGRKIYEISTEKGNVRRDNIISENTVLFAEETTSLLQEEEATWVLDEGNMQADYRLVFHEMVVHTREKI